MVWVGTCLEIRNGPRTVLGMLTLPDFSRLPLEAQLSYLWERGTYLESRLERDGCIVRLYQVDFFFVEVCFRSIDEFRLLQAFKDPTSLMPYVERVNLGDLLE